MLRMLSLTAPPSVMQSLQCPPYAQTSFGMPTAACHDHAMTRGALCALLSSASREVFVSLCLLSYLAIAACANYVLNTSLLGQPKHTLMQSERKLRIRVIAPPVCSQELDDGHHADLH